MKRHEKAAELSRAEAERKRAATQLQQAKEQSLKEKMKYKGIVSSEFNSLHAYNRTSSKNLQEMDGL